MEGKEYKRKEFYVSSDIWRKELSSKAKLILAYLSFCSNKDGECFPSVKNVAENCGMGTTAARGALHELAAKGYISARIRTVKKEGAGARFTSSNYRLLTERGPRKAFPPAEERSPAAERSPAEKSPTADSPAAEKQPAAKQRRGAAKKKPAASWRDGAELGALLERLDISGLYDPGSAAAKAIELAIKDMWYAEEIRFRGESIPQPRVRERLKQLDIDAIDDVMDKLDGQDVTDVTAYLKACIYNAPLQTSARIASELAAIGKRRGRGV